MRSCRLTVCYTESSAINIRVILTLKIHTKLIIKYLQLLTLLVKTKCIKDRKSPYNT